MDALGNILSAAIDLIWIVVLILIVRAIIKFIRGDTDSLHKDLSYMTKLNRYLQKTAEKASGNPHPGEDMGDRDISDVDEYDGSEDETHTDNSGESSDPFSGGHKKEKKNPFES